MTLATQPHKGRRRLILILCLLAALLRVAKLDTIPPALFRDEAEKLYNAFCLAHSGRDCSGHLLPLFVQVFGVTTSAIYQYATVPFVWLFGMGEWAARLPAALVGTCTVLLTFLWIEKARGTRAAMWAAVFLAFSPWHVVFSRWAQQGIFLPLFLAGAMSAWQIFLRGKGGALVWAAIALALAFYTYDVARAFVPLLMLLLCVLYWRELCAHWRWALTSALVFVILSLPTLWLLIFRTEAAQARFSRISIFAPGQSFSSVISMFSRNYVAHFSPSFLLLHGDSELRHGAGVGILTAFEFAALIMGTVVTARSRSRFGWLLLGWLLCYPVAASLTREGIPHALRSIVGIPAVQALAAIGVTRFERLARLRWKRSFTAILLAMQLLTFFPFAYRYWGDYRTRSAWNWQYGVKDSLAILERLEPDLDRIAFYRIFGAEYLVAVYRRIPPSEFRPDRPRIGKFEWLPFDLDLASWAPLRQEAVAVVTVPVGRPPSGVASIPIHAPNSKDVVAVIYLNENALKHLRDHAQQVSD